MKWFLQGMKRTFEIRGRSRRKEYWSVALVIPIIFLILLLLAAFTDIHINNFVATILVILFVILLISTFTALIRRLHDIGKSGWWVFIRLVPIVGDAAIFIFAVIDSEPGINKYGENPKINRYVAR